MTNILIVDDEPLNVEVLLDDLYKAGFKVLVAEDGETALKRVSYIKPDIILLDLKLPGIDGFETCRRLKEHETAKNVPIIFMSAVTDTVEKIKGLEVGAIDYITKPFQPAEVVARVEKHLTISQLQKRLEEQNAQLQQEIAERQRIEEALRESELKNRLLLQHSPDFIMNVERDGRVTYINHPWTGFVSEEVIGKNLIALLSPEDHEIYSQALRRVFEEKQPDSFEHDNPCSQSFCIRVVPIELEGQIVSAMVISTDITDRKKNAELEHAVRLKDEFLANMSHELRTPLSAILMMSEILMDCIHGTLNEKQLRSVKHIDTSARHLLSLINDILDLSKIAAGQMEWHPSPVNVTEICQASLQFVKQMAMKKQIKLLFASDGKLSTLLVDERSMKQILVNLLSNAVKFTPEWGRVVMELEGDENRKIACFSVSDTGIGIPESQIERMFQPFVQIDGSLSRSHEGTGLGLSLVSKLAEAHGGSVTVESTVGKGSKFIVSLPWLDGSEVSQSVAKTEKVPTIDEKVPSTTTAIPTLVLLVEDQEINIFGIQNCLANCGYEVIVASNGKEALEKIKEKKPALILMDIQMPVMDGLEAIRKIRADKEVADIPIIALTALAMSGDRERCLEVGANEYLSKPVNLRKLVSVISELLSDGGVKKI
jgi:PAS domain S-box-containing protein